MRSKELKAAPARQDCVWIATLRKPVGIKGRVAFAWRDPFSFDSVQLSGCWSPTRLRTSRSGAMGVPRWR